MLFKAIYYGKEHRKPYSNRCLRKNGWYCLYDFSHNPDTQDPYVKSDRLHSNRKREVASYFDIQYISQEERRKRMDAQYGGLSVIDKLLSDKTK